MKGKRIVKLSLTAVAAIAVLAFLAGAFFLGFSARKVELRDDRFVLVGPQVKATRIISRKKLLPERHPVLCSVQNDQRWPVGIKGVEAQRGENIDPQAITALDNAEYSCWFLDGKNYARIYEKVCQGKRTIVMDVDFSDMFFSRKMNDGETGVLELVAERELQIIEQDIYLDYRKGIDSEFKTVQYVVCPFTKLSAECVIYPTQVTYTDEGLVFDCKK